MGCYGLGVSRILQASVEVLSTDQKIRWPSLIAPYQVCIIRQKVVKLFIFTLSSMYCNIDISQFFYFPVLWQILLELIHMYYHMYIALFSYYTCPKMLSHQNHLFYCILSHTDTVKVIRQLFQFLLFYWWRKTSGAPPCIISGTIACTITVSSHKVFYTTGPISTKIC